MSTPGEIIYKGGLEHEVSANPFSVLAQSQNLGLCWYRLPRHKARPIHTCFRQGCLDHLYREVTAS